MTYRDYELLPFRKHFGSQVFLSPTTIIRIDAYEHVRKNGAPFHSFRAVGLAIELPHRTARDKGFGKVDASDLATVNLSGSRLQACIEGTWRKVAQGAMVKLQLTAVDRKLPLALF